MTTERERHEAAYMEAVRSTVVKITYGGSGGKTLSLKEINAQINELLKASIGSAAAYGIFFCNILFLWLVFVFLVNSIEKSV